MKRIILGLLLAAIASPAMAQTLDDFRVQGQRDAFLTCLLISKGYTSSEKISEVLGSLLEPQQKAIMNIVFFQMEKGDGPAAKAYTEGFGESIQICESEFNKLTD